MSIQWKSMFIIIGTLVIGMLIGIFLAGPVLHRHLRPPFEGRGPHSFSSVVMRVIQPAPEQEAELREVLDRHSARLDSMRADFRQEMVVIIDSMRADLDPILTDEQKARLDEHHRHLDRLIKGKPGRRGHHPEPPGGHPGD